MVATVAAFCGQRDRAIDAVDEAFARAVSQRSRVEAMSSPEGWILTVAFNEVKRGITRSARRRRAEETAPAASWIEPHDPRFDLWTAVGDLPDKQRQAVALRYLADLSEPQIAEVMGVAVGTVSASLAAARRSLAARLAIDDEEGGRS